MTGMLETIAPKSDQINFDDFIGGQSKTIKITKVTLTGGDQPATLNYENDNGKPYKPGKSMRRVLIHVWGEDGNKYVGRSLTLYGDAKVVFGGSPVGGIRISHMSDISAPVTMALTTTRSNRKPFTVLPLIQSNDEPNIDTAILDIAGAANAEILKGKYQEYHRIFRNEQSRSKLTEAKNERKKQLTQGETNE